MIVPEGFSQRLDPAHLGFLDVPHKETDHVDIAGVDVSFEVPRHE